MKIINYNREIESGLRKYNELFKTSSPLFQAVENIFDEWIKGSNPAGEYREKYFGEDAIYTKKGAIQQAIEQIFEVMDEYDLPEILLSDNRLDLTCAFEG